MPKFLNNVDLNKNQLLNAVIQNLSTEPSTGTSREGQIYWNTTSHQGFVFDGTNWISFTNAIPNGYAHLKDDHDNVADAIKNDTIRFHVVHTTGTGILDVTVTDDDPYYGDNVTITISNSAIDHGLLAGLSDDDHPQYVAKDGRSGGQIVYGGTGVGDDLILLSTTNGTKGSVDIGNGVLVVDESNSRATFTALQGETISVSGQITSTVATNTAPLVIASTTKVNNLNADLLDGYDTATAASTNKIPVTNGTDGKLDKSFVTELLNIGDLANISGTTGTGSTVVLDSTPTISSPTITTPTISGTGWTNANHTHQGATTGGQLDHGAALTGLGDDDHTQYVHNTTARTITAIHNFNPGSAGSQPFNVGANGTATVTRLSADKVDGYDAATTRPGNSSVVVATVAADGKIDATFMTEKLATTDLTDVSAKTGNDGGNNTTIVFAACPVFATVTDGVNNPKAIDANTGRVVNVGAPQQASDAATKQYVDSMKTGLGFKQAVRVATIAPLPTNTLNTGTGVLTASVNGSLNSVGIDGITDLAVSDRVLVKNESGDTADVKNGIYVVTDLGSSTTKWVLTRANDADQTGELTAGSFVFVQGGDTNTDTSFVLSTDGDITINTTPIQFTQFSGAGQITAGDGMTKSGNVLNVGGTTNRIAVTADAVDIDANYVGQTSITTLGTVATGVWHGTEVGIVYGGTGATTKLGARTNLSESGSPLPQKYTTTIGDGSSTNIAVTHGLNTQNVIVSVRAHAGSYEFVYPDIEATNTTTVTLRFATAPASSEFDVTVIG